MVIHFPFFFFQFLFLMGFYLIYSYSSLSSTQTPLRQLHLCIINNEPSIIQDNSDRLQDIWVNSLDLKKLADGDNDMAIVTIINNDVRTRAFVIINKSKDTLLCTILLGSA